LARKKEEKIEELKKKNNSSFGHSSAQLLIRRPFIIVMVNDHDVIVLATKKDPILGLHKLVPNIIVKLELPILHSKLEN
jgi:hypothetical protein